MLKGRGKNSGDRDKRNKFLADEGLGDDYVDRLKKEGFKIKEIMEAKLLVERVMFQLHEITTENEKQAVSPKIEVEVPGSNTNRPEDDTSFYAELAGKMDIKTAVTLMLKLRNDFGSLEKVLDEYLFSLQAGINLEDYLTDKRAYQKQRNEKSLAIDREKVITMAKIEEKMLKKAQESNTDIPPEIQDLIRQSDPANFDKNITNYKNLLIKLNVHTKFKNEIERLITAGHKLPDILVDYEFLNDSFGQMQEIEMLVRARESGKSWAAVFEDYNRNNPEFVPGSFEPGYLENLMKTPGITSDDIMIADRVSQKVSKPFKDVLEKRISRMLWKVINAELDVVNAQTKIPHVPVTPEQIDKYTSSEMEKEKVVLAFVIAMKMEKNVEDIINRIKAGATKEQIYDECYTQKYY
jgi:hypothetical protein